MHLLLSSIMSLWNASYSHSIVRIKIYCKHKLLMCWWYFTGIKEYVERISNYHFKKRCRDTLAIFSEQSCITLSLEEYGLAESLQYLKKGHCKVEYSYKTVVINWKLESHLLNGDWWMKISNSNCKVFCYMGINR